MSTGRNTKAVVADDPRVCGTAGGSSFAQRLRDGAHALREGWLQVCGIPDYERYLAHHAERHPGEPALSQRDFFARAIDRRYCKSGPRCC